MSSRHLLGKGAVNVNGEVVNAEQKREQSTSQVVLQTPTLSLLGKSAGKEERVEAAENSRKQIIIVSDKKLMNPYFQKLYVRSLRTF